MRRIIIRTSLIVLWIGAIAAIFFLNRGHTVFVDNKAASDGTYEAVELMKVSLDGGKGLEFFPGDRDRFPVTGAKHRIRIEFMDGRPPLVKEFRLPLTTDLFLLSVPKMIAGIEPFVEPFHMEIATSRNDDEGPAATADPAAPAAAPEGPLAPDGSPVVGGAEVLLPVAP
jgi:hypothetical protein